MQKLHRRKNQEIIKQYICSQGCGKAYASYAAVYTHVKNKHPNSKPPQMKSGTIFKIPKDEKILNKFAEKRKDIEIPIILTYDCKICKKVDCICPQNINYEELERSVILLGDQTFIKFINSIGQLQQNQMQRLIRDTQLPHQYITKQKIRQMAHEFNQKYEHLNQPQIIISNKWAQYLSFSSQYWDPQCINQLYNCIFMIMSKQNVNQINNAIQNLIQFQNIKKISSSKRKQWIQFVDFIQAI